MVRAIASPIVALLAMASPPVVAGTAAASPAPETTRWITPVDRGIDPADRDDDMADDEQAPDECPTELWTIPLEVKGLACILLLSKDKDAQDPEAADGTSSEPGRWARS